MRILHITNWYPNRDNPYEALWVKKHIEALVEAGAECQVYHLRVYNRAAWFWKNYQDESGAYHMELGIPGNIWLINELLHAFLLYYVALWRVPRKSYDRVNLHIAYPLALYLAPLKRRLKWKVAITEHWSAYHYHFHITKAQKLKRLQKMFHHGIPLIPVSAALGKDIQHFAERDDFPVHVIPNIVDGQHYSYLGEPLPEQPTFFMLSQWKDPKRPELALQAFQQLLQTYPEAQLRIGGYGPQEPTIQAFIKDQKLETAIHFLGKLHAEQIRRELNSSWAFVHPSDYETFSVVCAEAICSGTPVIASAVGGIPDFITDQNGVLILENNLELWIKAWQTFMDRQATFDRSSISALARQKFGKEQIGKRYYQILNNL